MKKQTLDSAMTRLDEILNLLENGSNDLEESMKLYEEGVNLVSCCNKALLKAKQKITELSENHGDDENNE